MVTNKNNMREVEGVTHHIGIFQGGEKTALHWYMVQRTIRLWASIGLSTMTCILTA